MNNYYISFDQSTTKTGYCVWKDGNYYTHGLIDCHKDKEQKFENMTNGIIDILKKYNPTVVTIEDTSLQGNAKTLKDLAQLQGVILGYCISNDIYCSVYAPSKWRKMLGFKTGKLKRAELKELAISYVKNTYGFNTSEDEAESICIGAAVLSKYI